MRFTSSLFALSSIFATNVFAAPTVQRDLVVRHDNNPFLTSLSGCVENVKTHTSVINATIAGDITDKSAVITVVKGEVGLIIELLAGIIGEVSGFISSSGSEGGALLGGTVGGVVEGVGSIGGSVGGTVEGVIEGAAEIKGEVISLVFGLLAEILFTLNAVLGSLKICTSPRFNPYSLFPAC